MLTVVFTINFANWKNYTKLYLGPTPVVSSPNSRVLWKYIPRMDTLQIKYCHVCEKMRERKPTQKETGPIETCLLCNRCYCEAHKSPDQPQVCEVNHFSYYRNHPTYRGIYPDMKGREAALENRKVDEKEAIANSLVRTTKERYEEARASI